MNTQDLNSKATAQLSVIAEELSEVAQLQKQFNEQQVKFIKDIVNPDLTDNELFIFIRLSNKLRLNPLTGEIIAVVYNKDKPADRRVNTIITRSGKRVVATRTGELRSLDSVAIYVVSGADGVKKVEEWEGGKLWGAEATCIRNDVTFRAVVPLSEYDTGRNVWATKKSTMIKKVAESQVLSQAFPEILGSVYDESEQESMEWKPNIPTLEQDKPAQEAQIKTLQSMGVNVPEKISYNEAVKLMAEAVTKPKKSQDSLLGE